MERRVIKDRKCPWCNFEYQQILDEDDLSDRKVMLFLSGSLDYRLKGVCPACRGGSYLENRP